MDSIDEILFTEISGKDGNLGLVTLNRPKTFNALTYSMIVSLYQQLKVWEKQNNIKAVVVRATEGRAFCAGGDIRHLYEAGKENNPDLLDFFKKEYRLNLYISRYTKPYIPLMDGITMGGGVGISVHGSHRVATERLVFAMPETSIGFFPDVGGTYFLPHCPGKTGLYLGLTGDKISASDAMFLGLADHVLDHNKIESFISALADTTFAASGHEEVTSLLNTMSLAQEESSIEKNKNIIDSSFSGASMEDIIDKLTNSTDAFSNDTLNTLNKRSPTSLKVVFKQLTTGSTLELEECLRLEYGIVKQFLKTTDWYEGVRALIIDKDQNPKWNPATLADVDDTSIESFFAPYPDDELSFS